MPRHKVFNPDESSPIVNSSVVEKVTPKTVRLHPALIGSKTPASSAKKGNKIPNNANPREANKNLKPESQDSDSDSLDVPGFFSGFSLKLPYTKEEDEIILNYVLKGQNIFKVGSISLWKQLEAKKKNPRRTYQSLKNRFLRNIKPHLFSTYGHLIKDKTTAERILTKFPELKKKMGRKETLSRVKLPERLALKPAEEEDDEEEDDEEEDEEEDGVSSTSINEFQQNTEGTALQLSVASEASDIHTELVRLEPLEWPKIVIHPRMVTASKEGLTVCLNLNLKKYVVIPPIGIFEKFQQLSKKNKLVLCHACGRYNRPKKVTPLKSSRETDVLIPNSLDTAKTRTKGLNKINHNSKCISKKAKQGKKISTSEASCKSPCSPSLLKEIGEAGELDKFTPGKTEGNSTVAQVEVVSNSVTVRKDFNVEGIKVTQMSNSCTESRSKIVRITRGSNSGSSKEGNSRTGKRQRQRDSDEDLDSICEDAMANFRKLIDHEEERQLVKKCLNKNYKSIGLEAVSQTNWDSYFLDSSSEMDTPPLTIDYETDSQTQNNENETQSERTSDTSLAKNMRKMLREKIRNPDRGGSRSRDLCF